MSKRRHTERERQRKGCFCSLLDGRKFTELYLQDKKQTLFLYTHVWQCFKKWLIFNQTPLWAVGWWMSAPGEGWQDKHQSIAKTTAGGGDIYHTKVATTTCRRLSPGDRSVPPASEPWPSSSTKHLITKLYKTRGGNKRGETFEWGQTQKHSVTSGLQKLSLGLFFQVPETGWTVHVRLTRGTDTKLHLHNNVCMWSV